MHRNPFHCILPPGVLQKLAEHPDTDTAAILATLALDTRMRLARAEAAARVGGHDLRTITFARVGGQAQRTIYDQGHKEEQALGRVARAEGQDPVSDEAVNQAYDGLGDTYKYYWETFKRDSIDGQGMPLLGLVHYGRNYDNAFWDNAGHMFFGDGGGQVLTHTTAGIDVIGHELTHGVTQHEANLVYSGQSGALNESISDVFGIQVKQKSLGQDSASSDWLIGAEVVGTLLQPALRSMKEPGTANQHDDQPATMDGYDPSGDVHTNSGIPNRAFYVVASELGGNSWDVAGPIWYEALRDQRLRPDATFRDFALVTLSQARARFGEGSKEVAAVAAGWEDVKLRLH